MGLQPSVVESVMWFFVSHHREIHTHIKCARNRNGYPAKKKRNKGDIFISLWNAFGIIVILGFFVFSMIIGGSAGLGYQENGRFFVRDHAEVVEVSKILWEISNIWGILFWIFIPLTPIGAFVISNIQEKIEQRKNRFE